MHDAGTERLLERLADPAVRERIKRDLLHNDDYENWVKHCGWDNIVISSVASDGNRRLEGKSVAEIAMARSISPADAAIDLIVEEHGNVAMVVHWGAEEDVASAMRHPLQMVGSDSIFGGRPHPRLLGTFPRVLGHYVRERGVLTLEEAIRHMTGAPARLLRLNDRGLLHEGYAADLVLFDPLAIRDRSTYEEPLKEPEGIAYVFVNGQAAVSGGKYTGVTAGTVVRRRGDKAHRGEHETNLFEKK